VQKGIIAIQIIIGFINESHIDRYTVPKVIRLFKIKQLIKVLAWAPPAKVLKRPKLMRNITVSVKIFRK